MSTTLYFLPHRSTNSPVGITMNPTEISLSSAATLPEIFLALAALVLLLASAFGNKGGVKTVNFLAILSLLTAAFMAASGEASDHFAAWGGMLINDAFARFSKVAILLSAALALLISPPYLSKAGISCPEYPVLAVFAALGMMIMVSANDLMTLYLGIELQSLPLYVMAAFRRDDAKSGEAGLKYFVLGAVASGMLLYGASLLYGYAGSTGFAAIAESLRQQSGETVPLGVLFGMVFICAALAFKVSAVPFHMWTPDVYQGAPASVAAFFSAAPKLAAMALLARILEQPMGGLSHQWTQIIAFVAVASMLVGGLGGLMQTNLRRLMAYSSIANVGAALVGLAAGGSMGIQATLTYMAIYAVNTLGAFAVILCLRRDGNEVEKIQDVAGLSRSHPALALAMAVFMFSLAGVPPMAGFFGKYFVFLSAVKAGMLPLAVIGVLASVVAAFYYLRVVKAMYFDEAAADAKAIDGVPEKSLRFGVAVAACAALLLVAAPAPLLDRALAAAQSLAAL